ncbi:hypothetical protein [Paenibacillus sp. L3-i20]|nr:hypothetical protein [Paenibacillus sp. L3-i20]
MNAMLDDVSFNQEIKGQLNPFRQAIQEQHIDASPWQEKYKQNTTESFI